MRQYAKDKGSSIHENDITVKKRENEKERIIEVPISHEDNFGKKMAIDEKQIGKDFYTIISNRQSGKIAMVTKAMKYIELEAVIDSHPLVIGKVKSITRDFPSLYKKVSNEIFSGSIQIGNKFHVVKHLMEAHQSITIRYRQKELEKRRIAFNEFKQSEKERELKYKETGKQYRKKKFHYKEQRYKNGETSLKLLVRSRYLLYKFENKWSSWQRERAKIVFKLYPEIEKAYRLSCEFRNLTSKNNIGKDYLWLNKRLIKWYEKVEESEISEMLNFQSMVECNEEYIMNYFICGETNASAEAINSKIQKFISSNNGNRDKDFFFFRLDNYFA